MPLSPIQMFQNTGQNSIEGLLRAGPEAIANIMNQAVSLGRSMADKQLAQERDLFAMRQQETNLAQRRAENTQQDMEDALRFGRAAFESDRRYATDVANQEFQKSRISANDAFSQDIQSRRLGLMENREEEEKRAREASAANLLRIEEDVMGTGVAPEAAPTSPEPPLGYGGMPEATGTPGYAAQRGAAPSSADMFTPPAEPASPSNNIVDLETKLDASKRQLENYKKMGGVNEDVFNSLNRQVNSIEAEIDTAKAKPEEADAAKPPSPTAESREIKGLLMNPTAFPAQTKFIGSKSTEDEIAAAKAYDANKFESEIGSALAAKDEETYVNMGGKSEADKAARRKLYQYAKKVGTVGGSTTTPPSDSPWNVPELR